MHDSSIRRVFVIPQWAFILVFGIVVGAHVSFVFTKLFIPPVYQARTSILISITVSQEPNDNTIGGLAMMPTYVQTITSPYVLAPIAARHNLSVDQLRKMTFAQLEPYPAIIDMTVENQDPRLAAQLANEVAQSFIRYANGQFGRLTSIYVISPADVPHDPVRPQPLVNAALGAGAGLCLALLFLVGAHILSLGRVRACPKS